MRNENVPVQGCEGGVSRRIKYALRRAACWCRIGLVLPIDVAAHLYGGTDKWSHGYTKFYDRHFRPFRLRRCRLLEIGVGGYAGRVAGGSLRVLRDYFFRARVVGMDLYDKDVALGPRVGFVRGDQTSPADLARAVEALGGAADIIIDDGSHRAGDIVASFEYLFPRMANGGLYVIEDLHTSYYPDFGGGRPATHTSGVGLIKELVDSVQVNDPTFRRKPDRGPAPDSPWADVAAVNVYPGVVIIEKVSGIQ